MIYQDPLFANDLTHFAWFAIGIITGIIIEKTLKHENKKINKVKSWKVKN